jgi:hypothetical protein
MPYLYTQRVRSLAETIGLDPRLIDVVDLRTPALPGPSQDKEQVARDLRAALSMGLGKLKGMDPSPPSWRRITQRALVVGGGIAGMTAAKFDPARATLKLQGTTVFSRGQPVPFDAAAASESLKAREVKVLLTCNLGKAAATCWTCDFSKEYVTINADYHT